MPSKSWDYRRNVALLKQESMESGADCLYCHGRLGPIRYDHDPKDPLSFSVDHIIATADGGSDAMSNLRAPLHVGCNASRSTGKRGDAPTSRRWLK